MNAFVPDVYDELVYRLALGIEALDAIGGGRIARTLDVRLEPRAFDVEAARRARQERREPTQLMPRVRRHTSCRLVVLYSEAGPDRVDIRFSDPQQEYAPRRIRFPLRGISSAEGRPYAHRVRRPILFPGAAYPHAGCATGIRGRVKLGTDASRWTRVEARRGGTVVGRAQADHAGEFLLLIDANAAPGVSLPSVIHLDVTAFGRAAAPLPTPSDLPSLDHLWDVPLEVAPAPPDTMIARFNDPVSDGTELPADYTASSVRSITFTVGEIRSEIAPFVLS